MRLKANFVLPGRIDGETRETMWAPVQPFLRRPSRAPLSSATLPTSTASSCSTKRLDVGVGHDRNRGLETLDRVRMRESDVSSVGGIRARGDHAAQVVALRAHGIVRGPVEACPCADQTPLVNSGRDHRRVPQEPTHEADRVREGKVDVDPAQATQLVAGGVPGVARDEETDVGILQECRVDRCDAVAQATGRVLETDHATLTMIGGAELLLGEAVDELLCRARDRALAARPVFGKVAREKQVGFVAFGDPGTNTTAPTDRCAASRHCRAMGSTSAGARSASSTPGTRSFTPTIGARLPCTARSSGTASAKSSRTR